MDSEDQTQRMTQVDLDTLASIYIKMRDARDTVRREAEAKEKEIQEEMQVIEQQMLDACKALGADSIRTPHGTIIRSVKSRYWTNDWDSMYRFIKSHDAFGLLEKRLHQTHMKEFLDENPGTFPEGMNVENQYSVVVRRSKEK
jgi:hypothetical protein